MTGIPQTALRGTTPFSIYNNWLIAWAEHRENWRGLERGKALLTEGDFKVLQAIRNIGFATNLQIAKLLSRNMTKGKQRVKKLERLGFLLEHKLYNNQRSSIAFYSLGPGCYGIVKGYQPLQDHPTVFKVLERLSVFQLYTRFKEKITNIYTKKSDSPTSYRFFINNSEFFVISLKGRLDLLAPLLKKEFYNREKDRKYILILENIADINELHELVELQEETIRYTTDDDLIRMPIDEAFYHIKDSVLIKDNQLKTKH